MPLPALVFLHGTIALPLQRGATRSFHEISGRKVGPSQPDGAENTPDCGLSRFIAPAKQRAPGGGASRGGPKGKRNSPPRKKKQKRSVFDVGADDVDFQNAVSSMIYLNRTKIQGPRLPGFISTVGRCDRRYGILLGMTLVLGDTFADGSCHGSGFISTNA